MNWKMNLKTEFCVLLPVAMKFSASGHFPPKKFSDTFISVALLFHGTTDACKSY